MRAGELLEQPGSMPGDNLPRTSITNRGCSDSSGSLIEQSSRVIEIRSKKVRLSTCQLSYERRSREMRANLIKQPKTVLEKGHNKVIYVVSQPDRKLRDNLR